MKIAIVLILCFGIGLVVSDYGNDDGSDYATKHADGNGYDTKYAADDYKPHSQGSDYSPDKTDYVDKPHDDDTDDDNDDDKEEAKDDSDDDEKEEEKKKEEHVEFVSDDFKELEPLITLYDAEKITKDQPKCKYVNECYTKFRPFGKQCMYRVYHYGNNYRNEHEDGYSNQDGYDDTNTYSKIYDRCLGADCSKIVDTGFSDSHGYVKLFKPFSECGNECINPKPYSGYAKYANYCGRITENGKEKCDCSTVFCVKSLTTAFFDKCGKLRKGTIRYKFQCKCSCRW